MRNGDLSRHNRGLRPETAEGGKATPGATPTAGPAAGTLARGAEILDLRRLQRQAAAERAVPQAAPAQPALAGEAFWDIWQANREHLMRQSLRLMAGNRADAEDALSTAMLKASQKFGLYAEEIVNQRAWLSRLLHNACMDLYRGYGRQGRPAGTAAGLEEEGLPAVVAEESSPEEVAEGREALRLLAERVAELPPTLRLPLLLRFVHNRSYDEIAAQLELTNCAVRKRIQLARERLRRELEL